MLTGQSTPARPGCGSLGSGASEPMPWLGDQSPTATSLSAPKPQEPDDPPAARDPPALVRAAALYPVQTAPKGCGCSVHLMPDKPELSDMMVSLQSSLHPGHAGGARVSPGRRQATSRSGRSRLIGQEQSWA